MKVEFELLRIQLHLNPVYVTVLLCVGPDSKQLCSVTNLKQVMFKAYWQN